MKRLSFPVQFGLVLGVFWLVLGGVLLLALPKGDLVLWFQANGTAQLDRLFKYLTQLGEAPFIIAISLLMLFQRMGAFIFLSATAIINGILIQLLKKGVFADALRPKLWFAADGITLNQVLDVPLNGYNAMPSGHTAAAFALFMGLGIISRNTTAQAVFFLLGLLVAISRIYLAQHFYEDVYFGALVGMSVSLGVYTMMIRQGWWDKPWAKQSLQRLLIKNDGR